MNDCQISSQFSVLYFSQGTDQSDKPNKASLRKLSAIDETTDLHSGKQQLQGETEELIIAKVHSSETAVPIDESQKSNGNMENEAEIQHEEFIAATVCDNEETESKVEPHHEETGTAHGGEDVAPNVINENEDSEEFFDALDVESDGKTIQIKIIH